MSDVNPRRGWYVETIGNRRTVTYCGDELERASELAQQVVDGAGVFSGKLFRVVEAQWLTPHTHVRDTASCAWCTPHAPATGTPVDELDVAVMVAGLRRNNEELRAQLDRAGEELEHLRGLLSKACEERDRNRDRVNELELGRRGGT